MGLTCVLVALKAASDVSSLKGPGVRAELTPLVPVSLCLRSGHLMETVGGLFQPVEDTLSVPQVPGQLTCLWCNMKICDDKDLSVWEGVNRCEQMG